LLVLFPVNPTMLAKYRTTFGFSHAKDDPMDAELARERLLPHPDTLHALEPESAAMRTLPQRVAQRRGVVADQVRLTNRLPTALK
jgi:hypothetical protein